MTVNDLQLAATVAELGALPMPVGSPPPGTAREAELLAENERLRRENVSLRARVVRDDVEFKEAMGELDEQPQAKAGYELAIDSLHDELAVLRQAIRDRDGQLADLRADLARLRAESCTEWGVRPRPGGPVTRCEDEAQAQLAARSLRTTAGTYAVAVTRTVHHSAWTEPTS